MKDVWKQVRWLFLAGGAPCLGFTLGVLVSFLVYPDDVEGASRTLTTFAGTGALVGIFLIVHRIRRIIRERMG